MVKNPDFHTLMVSDLLTFSFPAICLTICYKKISFKITPHLRKKKNTNLFRFHVLLFIILRLAKNSVWSSFELSAFNKTSFVRQNLELMTKCYLSVLTIFRGSILWSTLFWVTTKRSLKKIVIPVTVVR